MSCSKPSYSNLLAKSDKAGRTIGNGIQPNHGGPCPIRRPTLIRNLSGQSYKDVERAIFLSHLPMPVRTALASSKAPTNNLLADEANDIFLERRVRVRSRARNAVSAINAAPVLDGPEVEWIPDPHPQVNAMD